MDNWVKVFQSTMAHQSEIVKAVLEDNGIPAVILNKSDPTRELILQDHIEVYVHQEQAFLAHQLIKNDIHFG